MSVLTEIILIYHQGYILFDFGYKGYFEAGKQIFTLKSIKRNGKLNSLKVRKLINKFDLTITFKVFFISLSVLVHM